jgi:DNA-binding response OmpR family regulator
MSSIGAKKSILLAEDNRAIADVLRFNLQRAGFGVSVARDGAEAAALLQQDHFDLLITDYQMPRMSGEELCRQARREHDGDLLIFLCSAKGFELDINHLMKELDIRRVFFKPFSPREIVQDAREALGGCAVTV